MSNVLAKTLRNGLAAALILALGVLAGESMSPQEVVADDCPYQNCNVGATGAYCDASVNRDTCDQDETDGVCNTEECACWSPTGDCDDPGPVE